LYEINQFFIVTPPAEWKRRVSDNVPLGEMPLRTVKTLLLELVIGLDDRIFQHLTLIESPERSSVYPYLHHMLEACRKKEHMQHQQGFKQQQQPRPPQEMGHSRNSSLSRPSSISSMKSNTMIRSPSMASYSSGENPEQHVEQPAYSPRMQSQTLQQPMQQMQQQMQQPIQQQMQQPIDDVVDATNMTDAEFNRALTQIFNKIGDRGKTKEVNIDFFF
jgi:cytoskeleton-associated protein 5